MRRRLVAIWLVALMLFAFAGNALAASPADWTADAPQALEEGHLYAQSALVMDFDTGETLFDKDARVRMHPASTTKIMTLLLGLESGIDLDAVITIPQEAADIPKGSSLVPVNPGEQMTFRDLLYGMMLASGNDGANAVAVLVSGSIPAFVERMNQRALELGCEGTHFNNAHGYTEDNHYTTAMDLARITRAAMQNQVFREIVASKSYTMNVSARGQVQVQTRVTMMDSTSGYYYPQCIGIKTGFTNAAGQCFVGAADFQGRTVISVVLRTAPEDVNQKWLDTRKLFDYARTRYAQYGIVALYDLVSSQLTDVMISNAAENDPYGGTLSLKLAQLSNTDYSRLVLTDSPQDMSNTLNAFVGSTTIEITDDLTAPITEGEIIGNFRFQPDEGEIISGYLVASRSVEEQPQTISLRDLFPFLDDLNKPAVRMWIVILLLVVLLLVIVRIRRTIRRNRRRRRIYESRRRAAQRRRPASNQRRMR